MIYINKKPIQEINVSYFLDKFKNKILSKPHTNNSGNNLFTTHYSSDDIVVPKEYLEYINNSFIKNIPQNSKLCFDKSSAYPRFKLNNTKFNICRKKESADFLIVNASVGESYC